MVSGNPLKYENRRIEGQFIPSSGQNHWKRTNGVDRKGRRTPPTCDGGSSSSARSTWENKDDSMNEPGRIPIGSVGRRVHPGGGGGYAPSGGAGSSGHPSRPRRHAAASRRVAPNVVGACADDDDGDDGDGDDDDDDDEEIPFDEKPLLTAAHEKRRPCGGLQQEALEPGIATYSDGESMTRTASYRRQYHRKYSSETENRPVRKSRPTSVQTPPDSPFKPPTFQDESPILSIDSTLPLDEGFDERLDDADIAMMGLSNGDSFHASDQSPEWERPNQNNEILNYEEFGISTGSVTEGTASTSAMNFAMQKPQPQAKSLLRPKNSLSDDDSIFNFDGERARANKQYIANTLSQSATSNKSMGRKGVSSSRRARRQRRQAKHVRDDDDHDDDDHDDDDDDDDDDTSLDHKYGERRKRSSSLQQRAQQAFSSRNRALQQRTASTTAPTLPSSPAPQPLTHSHSKARPIVSFGDKNVVHHIEQEVEDSKTLTTAISGTSEYTKSLESEVEDAIKDLFFIGNGRSSIPGRRKVKKDVVEDDSTLNTYDDVTLNTLEESMDQTTMTGATRDTFSTLAGEHLSIPGSEVPEDTDEDLPHSEKKVENEKETPSANAGTGDTETDPINLLWGYFEGGVTAFSAALGLNSEHNEDHAKSQDAGRDTTHDMPKENRYETKTSALSSLMEMASGFTSPRAMSPSEEVNEMPQDPIESLEQSIGVGSVGCSSSPSVSPAMDEDGKSPETLQESPLKSESPDRLNHSTSGVLLGVSSYPSVDEGIPSLPTDPTSSKSTVDSVSAMTNLMNEDEPSTAPLTSLEDDPRLGELAIHAVRCHHQIHGVLFDESSEIEAIKEVKFIFVKIGLPLGILFQENNGGCWVAKVFPDGRAARMGVVVGDQLAAINGKNTIYFGVDEICSQIAAVACKDAIELTFLRYIGHLRPLCTVHQEKYTVGEPEFPECKEGGKEDAQKDRRVDALHQEIPATMESGTVLGKDPVIAPIQSQLPANCDGLSDNSLPAKKKLKPGKRFKWFGRGRGKQSK